MPVYEYRCTCKEEGQERLLPREQCDQPQICECGKVLKRKMSLFGFVCRVYGRDTLLDTLNAEEKRPFVDGTPVRSRRSKEALTSGLDYVVPLEDRVFTGFG